MVNELVKPRTRETEANPYNKIHKQQSIRRINYKFEPIETV
jgi:hypothetical protein